MLIVRCAALFVRVRIDQGGVDVDHVETRVHPWRTCSRSNPGIGLTQRAEGCCGWSPRVQHIVGIDVTSPKRPGWSPSTRRSLRALLDLGPIRDGRYMSPSTWPRSCPRRCCSVKVIASDRVSVRPTSSASSPRSRPRRATLRPRRPVGVIVVHHVVQNGSHQNRSLPWRERTAVTNCCSGIFVVCAVGPVIAGVAASPTPSERPR